MGKFGRPTLTLRYSGLFDFDALYAMMVDWAKNYGYRWHESTYKHKVPTPLGAEQELKWELTKKVTDYIQFDIKISWHTWDQTEIEVDVGGKKKTLTNARIYLKIDQTLTFDWQKKFAGSPFYKKLGDWYRYVVYKKETESIYFDQLLYRIYDLHALIRKYFDMQVKYYPYKGYLKED